MAKVMRVYLMALALVMVSVSLERRRVEAQVHHVVGGDRGWEPSSNVESWSSGRVFFVGDIIWFAYSAAQESITELRSREEFESCDLSNPIKMYTDGIDKVTLDGRGNRYFTSSKTDNCKNGLKLHVEVRPQPATTTSEKVVIGDALAAGPTPSGSVSVGLGGNSNSTLFWLGLWISHVLLLGFLML